MDGEATEAAVASEAVVTEAPAAAEGAATEEAAAPAVPTAQETAFLRNLRKQENRVVAEKQRIAEERKATKAEAERLAADRKALEEERRMLREDPLGYATKHAGIRDEDLARRWIGGGKPSAQEIEHQREESWRAELKKRDEEIASIKRQNEERAAAERVAAERRTNEEAIATFTATATASAAKFPTVARLIGSARETVLEDAESMAGILLRGGSRARGPAFMDEVLSRLESKYAKLSGVAAPAAESRDSKEGSAQADPRGNRVDPKTAPTLTGKTASQRSSTASDDDPLLDVLDPVKGRARVMKKIDEALAARSKAASH